MHSSRRALSRTLVYGCSAALFVAVVNGQSPAGTPSEANHFIETPKGWIQPKTPWGDPDLQGMWPISFVGSVPLERCAGGRGRSRAAPPPCDLNKAFLTDAEYQERFAAASKQVDRHAQAIAAGNFGQALQTGVTDPTAPQRQTSLIVDPPNGKLPEMTAEGKRLSALMKSSWALPEETPVWDSYLDFDSWDRCITRGMPSSMMPYRYNNGVHIMQVPGYVILDLEMVHETRIVPVDGRPALAPVFKQWMGESRGHWEGNTLVIVTTNFKAGASATNIGVMGSPEGNRFPTSEQLKTTERITRLNDDFLLYEIKTEDPLIVTRPWTARYPLKLDNSVRVVGVRLPRGQPDDRRLHQRVTCGTRAAAGGQVSRVTGRIALVVTTAFVAAFTITTAAAISDPVAIATGRISGVTLPSGVRAFKGIPFAAPPVGQLRWKEPQPVAKWEGIRKAEQFSDVCVQPSQPNRVPNNVTVDLPDSPRTSEDCLYLNVWTSANRAGDRLPVMVWIFGGAYTEGGGSSKHNDGENLARKGVVLVTFNYRLGPFGFFAHPELTKESGKNASGNQALADSIATLQWVKTNIAAFGGDPNNVTIFGESAGAAMVGGLVGSPVAKGLFHRAISESGAWMGLGMGAMTPREQAERTQVPGPGRGGRGRGDGAQPAAPPPPPPPLPPLAELRARSTEEVAKTLRGSGMIIDGWIVPEDLSITFANGKQNAVDVIAGSNKDEHTSLGGNVGLPRHDDVGDAPVCRAPDGDR